MLSPVMLEISYINDSLKTMSNISITGLDTKPYIEHIQSYASNSPLIMTGQIYNINKQSLDALGIHDHSNLVAIQLDKPKYIEQQPAQCLASINTELQLITLNNQAALKYKLQSYKLLSNACRRPLVEILN